MPEAKVCVAMRRTLVLVGVLCGLGGAAGCSFLSSGEREYQSYSELILAAGKASGFVVDAELYTLTALDLREDSATYQFRGVKYPGDHAWVVRFSEKSSEQNPLGLRDVYSLLPLIKEGRAGFELTEEGERMVNGEAAKFVRYRFRSPVHDGTGKPLVGHGIIAGVRLAPSGAAIVQHLKLDNHGDRDDVVWDDLRPFLPGT